MGPHGVLGVAYEGEVHPGGCFEALAAVARAVTALEPSQVVVFRPARYPAHLSPNSFSIKESDSAGVSDCARRLPYAASISRTFPRSVWTRLSPWTSV